MLRVSQAMVRQRVANQVLGLSQIFGRGHLSLAEAMAPDHDAILIVGDVEPKLMHEIHICFDCASGLTPCRPLCELLEARR